MKTLGIIGGIAPPSTIDYYRQLTSRYRARHPEGRYPSILIDSLEAAHFFGLLDAGDRAGMIEVLLAELGRLARAGADLALFASNSPHLVFDEVDVASPIPLISIVEATADVAEAEGRRTVGLLGARFTMEGGFYPAVFARRGIAVVVPEVADRAYIHERYFGELVEGIFREETRAGMAAVVDRMTARDGIEAVILGGTELPLLFREHPITTVPMLDTTTIHVEAAITRMLAQG
ncbi:MAG TPA: amino acid racemase [Candidatus Limnocylindrales bacterium]